jgi:hypothetical protein
MYLRLATVLIVVLLGVPVAWDVRAEDLRALPDVDLALVLEVHDAEGWLTMYDEVLSTSGQASRSLGLTLPGGTATNRYLTLNNPKFRVSLLAGTRTFNVVVSGKVGGVEALRGLGPFEQAIMDLRSGQSAADEVTLLYGLSSVGAHVIQLDVSRP